MNGPPQLLLARLEHVASRQRRLRLWLKLASCWAVAALLGLGINFLQRQIGWNSSLALPIIGLLGVAAASIIVIRHSNRKPDWRELAAQIEARHPGLDGRLITAVQQQAGD